MAAPSLPNIHPGKKHLTAQLAARFFPFCRCLLFKGLSLGKLLCKISPGGGIIRVDKDSLRFALPIPELPRSLAAAGACWGKKTRAWLLWEMIIAFIRGLSYRKHSAINAGASGQDTAVRVSAQSRCPFPAPAFPMGSQ